MQHSVLEIRQPRNSFTFKNQLSTGGQPKQRLVLKLNKKILSEIK